MYSGEKAQLICAILFVSGRYCWEGIKKENTRYTLIAWSYKTVMSGMKFNSKIVKYKEMISDVLYDEFKKVSSRS